MCAGACVWSKIGAVVFGVSQKDIESYGNCHGTEEFKWRACLISCKFVLQKGGLDIPVFDNFLGRECRRLFKYRPSWSKHFSSSRNFGQRDRMMSEIDSMTVSAPWARVNFGGANQPKGSGERSRYDDCRMRLPPGLPANCVRGYRHWRVTRVPLPQGGPTSKRVFQPAILPFCRHKQLFLAKGKTPNATF